jgi:intraflagellar transport protein 88
VYDFLFSRYLQLLGIVPTDPGVLHKMAEMYDSDGDKQQAYQYYCDVSGIKNL